MIKNAKPLNGSRLAVFFFKAMQNPSLFKLRNPNFRMMLIRLTFRCLCLFGHSRTAIAHRQIADIVFVNLLFPAHFNGRSLMMTWCIRRRDTRGTTSTDKHEYPNASIRFGFSRNFVRKNFSFLCSLALYRGLITSSFRPWLALPPGRNVSWQRQNGKHSVHEFYQRAQTESFMMKEVRA